ncbi:hypothetical protein [Rufibacter sp. XAAS-G3-1]|uniref:hypothetical protein n=1 Tax=Rufibacter sp. XAAS-G3-1 TaxID=2729134 RepID=UPI001C624DFB|nr:hypothetical protein [Rufibacter sp. XAAS-G3-1]
MGLITRVAIGFQIPDLIGAVFFFNAGHGFFSVNPQFALSLITLLALIFYFVGGSGYYSVGHTFAMNEKRLNQKKRSRE